MNVQALTKGTGGPGIGPRGLRIAGLTLILAVVALVAASTGAVRIPVSALLGGALSDQDLAVLTSIRLPRVLLAAVVGGALAMAGAAMQGLFRNPLADPGLIGIASGAMCAVAATIVFAGHLGGFFGLYGLCVAAFLGALGASALIFKLARLSGTLSVTYLLLAGIAVNAMGAAGTGFLAYISDDTQLRAITFWSMGSVGGALWPTVIVAASIILPAAFILLRSGRALNIQLLGEDNARCLGVDTDKLKRNVVVCTALAVGAAVAVSGIIGFVGLVVPHLIRLLFGADHRTLLPASALLGAILLVIADTVARTIVMPAEMPVGILTGLIGSPFFLWLLVRQYSGRFAL